MGLPGWQNIYDGKPDYGPCYFDETNILAAYATYQLPLGRGQEVWQQSESRRQRHRWELRREWPRQQEPETH